MSNLGSRLKEFRAYFKLSQSEAGERIGLGQQAWAQMEKRNAISRKNLQLLIEEFGISKEWMQTGNGEMLEERKGLKIKRVHSLSKYIKNGNELQAQDQFHLPFIDAGKECLAIKMASRSMEPEIKEGSTMVLEELEDLGQFVDGKIYVLVINEVPFVKRVQMILGGADSGKFKVRDDKGMGEQVIGKQEIERWYKVIYVINPV